MQENNQNQNNGGGGYFSSFIRMACFYFLISFVLRSLFQGNSQNEVNTNSKNDIRKVHSNLFKPGDIFDLSIYISESSNFTKFDDASALIWQVKGIVYNQTETSFYSMFFPQDSLIRTKTITIPITQHLLQNGSLFAHIYFTPPQFSHNPNAKNFDRSFSIYGYTALNKYSKLPKLKQRNLIFENGKENSTQIESEKETLSDKIVSFWKPNLTIHLVEDFTVFPRNSIPSPIENQMKFFDPDKQFYYPILYIDEFWLYKEHLIQINDSLSSLPLTLIYSPISFMKWYLMTQMEQSFSMQQSFGTSSETEEESFKKLVTDTNPYLLVLTFVVTLLHSIFDFLAFKNDITFWKNKKSMEGMSVRTIFLNCFCQFIIFLYLLDNETSWVILISVGISLMIEIWKIKKAVIIKVDWSKKFPITFEDRESYSASRTKEYDALAMKYLSYVLYPLVFCYAMYSLIYETHKSWYSWILSTLTGCVYTFGFIMMCPQLFINYKLKSVAHLPWKTFTYKALNTFIDDLFSFIMKMPLMHRISCFRDDIIFLIYLYQRWIYPVDYKRTNEFGQGGEDQSETSKIDTNPNAPKPLEEKKND